MEIRCSRSCLWGSGEWTSMSYQCTIQRKYNYMYNSQIFPFMRDYDDEDYKAGIIDGRKMRIMMRGIKIGR